MNASFFQRNRDRLQHALGGQLTVLAAFDAMQQTNDAEAPYIQEANFWWLTGIEEPGWMVILDGSSPGRLVAPTIDAIHQTFNGNLSWDDARRISGIKEVITSKQANLLLKQLAGEFGAVRSLGGDPHAAYHQFVANPAPAKLYAKLKRSFKDVQDCRIDLARLRAIKQPEEIAIMRKAISLTVDAFEHVKKQLPALAHEYQVEAEFTHYFRSHGASGHAYEPIVAHGKNACTLHYGKNNDALSQNQLLLLDIGARVEGYAADITRTYGVGEITERQRAVHAAVEKAHHKIIGLLKPNLRVDEYSKDVDEIMQAALKELGLLKKPEDYRRYFPHAISHGLGIDVHDALGAPEFFKSGMVLTVEPGIYIPEEGIGVRIEDDILITDTGHENLSAALSTSL